MTQTIDLPGGGTLVIPDDMDPDAVEFIPLDMPPLGMTVFEALTTVRRQMPTIEKNRNAPASQGGYAFAGIESYLAAANPLMDAVGLHVIPHRVVESRYQERPTKGGGIMHASYVRVQYRIYGPAGDFIEGMTEGEAADSGDKATPKAMTAARKAFLKEMLRITSEGDDADAGDPPETVRGQRDEVDPDSPDAWFIVHGGWADQAEHDHTRRKIIEAMGMLPSDVKRELQQAADAAGISFSTAMTRPNADKLIGWLPQEARESVLGRPGSDEAPTAVPPAPQDAPEAPSAPAPKTPKTPGWGKTSVTPDGVDPAEYAEHWRAAVAEVDALQLGDVTNGLSARGLDTSGNGPDKRMRLAIAIADELLATGADPTPYG